MLALRPEETRMSDAKKRLEVPTLPPGAEPDLDKKMEGMRELGDVARGEGWASMSVADLAEVMEHPEAKRVITELLTIEAQSVKEGDAAPDFNLPWLPGSEPKGEHAATLRLSDHFGKRPVALIFGSYT